MSFRVQNKVANHTRGSHYPLISQRLVRKLVSHPTERVHSDGEGFRTGLVAEYLETKHEAGENGELGNLIICALSLISSGRRNQKDEMGSRYG
jgi:hypothetical protein